METSAPVSRREIAQTFLKLGTIGFGGPAAHIALMNSEIAQKRKWVSQEEILDFMSAANFIPGPNSTEVALHIGYRTAGWSGLIVAGASFILPAAIIVSFIAWAYVSYGTLPQSQAVLYGVKPVIVAVILQALWNFAKSAVKTKTLACLAVASCLALAAGVNELVVLIAAGFLSFLAARGFKSNGARLGLLPFTTPPALTPEAASTAFSMAVVPVTLSKLFLFFLKVGSVLFGSGYVLVAFLRADLVERFHWLSEAQLLDAIAVGQFTPGPVFTTATFIGYVLAGAKGAALATLGIFLPAFIFVALTAPFLRRLSQSPSARAFLNGLNAASLAFMAFATFTLSKVAITNLATTAIAVFSFVLLTRTKINSAYLVAMGALAGLLLR